MCLPFPFPCRPCTWEGSLSKQLQTTSQPFLSHLIPRIHTPVPSTGQSRCTYVSGVHKPFICYRMGWCIYFPGAALVFSCHPLLSVAQAWDKPVWWGLGAPIMLFERSQWSLSDLTWCWEAALPHPSPGGGKSSSHVREPPDTSSPGPHSSGPFSSMLWVKDPWVKVLCFLCRFAFWKPLVYDIVSLGQKFQLKIPSILI